MHGIKRVKQTPEALAAKRAKEQVKIQEFTALTDDLLRRKLACDYSEEAFRLTSRLLQLNPEFFTIWNYRRLILLNGLFVDSPSERMFEILKDELDMTMTALRTHPKVYWIWNHRRWCLEAIPHGPGAAGSASHDEWRTAVWTAELRVVEKMLDADARNFHAWDYRRYCLSSMPVARPETAELDYTSKKIAANFSNFSAWHQRSKVLPRLWKSGALDEQSSREQEFDLIRNAMYTEPEDQSVWVYHRWLVGTRPEKLLLQREVAAIRELLEEAPNSKWCKESIVHYNRLFLSLYPSDPTSGELKGECCALLKELEIIDPFRVARYRDLARDVV